MLRTVLPTNAVLLYCYVLSINDEMRKKMSKMPIFRIFLVIIEMFLAETFPSI